MTPYLYGGGAYGLSGTNNTVMTAADNSQHVTQYHLSGFVNKRLPYAMNDMLSTLNVDLGEDRPNASVTSICIQDELMGKIRTGAEHRH